MTIFFLMATKEALAEIGKKIKETSSVSINHSDLHVGFGNIFYDYKTIKSLIDEGSYFKGKCLTAVGKTEWDSMRWTGSASLKKTIMNDATFSFVALENSTDYVKHLDALEAQSVRSYLLDCSDAHDFSDSSEKDRIGNSSTWIKADTTFAGLKQVANDKSRIFVGDKPSIISRLEENKTKFISALGISKKSNSSLSEVWFDNFELNLNPGMVAIIGNKGNGKSAIADTIGLIGNTPNFEHFSFLNKDKFRKKRPTNKAEHFEGTLHWASTEISTWSLSTNPEQNSVERVKYIPQSFLEKLCNEDVANFEEELRQVIFSHLSDADRLGKGSLEELIEFKTEMQSIEISKIQSELKQINSKVAELENQRSDEYKNQVSESLQIKQSELKALVEPQKVNPPEDDALLQKSKELAEKIETTQGELKTITEEIEKEKIAISQMQIDLAELEKMERAVGGLKSEYQKFVQNTEPILQKYSIRVEDVVVFQVTPEKLEAVIRDKKKQLTESQTKINAEQDDGLIKKEANLRAKIKELQLQLDEPSKLYQKYLESHKEWKRKSDEINGSASLLGSIEFYKAKLKHIDEQLPKDIEDQIENRRLILRQLFKLKVEEINLYKSLFRPVLEFIKNYGDLLADYSISLDVGFKNDGFEDKFFNHINLGSSGSFIGNPAGLERLKEMTREHDLSTEDDVVRLLEEVVESLHFDKRDGFNNVRREIKNQLKKGYSTEDLYAFLYGLEYLKCRNSDLI